MATEYLFSNNATTTLAQSVSAAATVLNVASGTGSLFPSPASGQAFAVTLVDAATGLTNEICYCTSRSGDQLTVIRGQEGTNATAWQAGDTCANYITADVMENWLQESDLDGYATEAWSDARYIQRAVGSVDYSPLQGGVNKATGEMWFSYADASGTIKYAFAQPAGDYATNTALTAETNRATTVESNLQSSKVNRDGDTLTGTLNINVAGGGVLLSGNGGGDNVPGGISYAAGIQSAPTVGATPRAIYRFINVNGVGPFATIWLTGNDGRAHELRFGADDRLRTASGNVFALETDISNLQNQINGKQPAGNYVTGESTGKKIVTFTASVSGTQDISFSGLSSVDVVLGSCSTQPNSSNSRGGLIQINSWTNDTVNVTGKFTSTNISDSTDLPCYFVAIGDA